MNEQEKQTHLVYNLREAALSLDEALTRLRKCIYIIEAADKTVNQLLDEENSQAVSIISDMATLKAVIADVEHWRSCAASET